jgi:serine protease Do
MFKISSTPRAVWFALVGCGLLGGVLLRTFGWPGNLWARKAETVSFSATQASPPGGHDGWSGVTQSDFTEQLAGVFVGLARAVTPAVVRVESRRPGQAGPAMQDVPEPFRQFFDLPQGGGGQSTPPPEEMAGGSGVIVSPNGYILTNAHVVDQADRILVQLNDQTSHNATLVGADPTTDLAVIKIEGQSLPTLAFGSSDGVEVGEPVMAVGNPGFAGTGSLDYTVTTGIVSALGRPLSIIRQSLQDNPDLAGYAIENFVQTDAVINPGNSGGPLVDLQGQVVGINSALASSNGYYQGYGFAIPSDLAKHVSDDIIAHGRVIRAWLGVSVTPVSSEDAEVYGLPKVSGVLVQGISDGSPAQQAGLRTEDVVVAVNGKSVQDSGDLQERIAELEPGSTATLDVYRAGKAQSISVKLGEAPLQAARTAPAQPEGDSPEALLGLTVADLTPALAQDFGYARAGGVVVTDVTRWSPAMMNGLAPGLKITEVDHTPVSDVRTFHQTIGGLKAGEVVTLNVLTPDGRGRIVNLRAEKH